MIKYWYMPHFIQKIIQYITPKFDDFSCVVTKQWDGTWTFSKWIIKDEPFCGGSDWVISTIYCDKSYKVAQDGDQAKITVSINKPSSYDTVFEYPVATTNGHIYKCSATQADAFVCDVAQVFFKGVPDKFYITIDPIK